MGAVKSNVPPSGYIGDLATILSLGPWPERPKDSSPGKVGDSGHPALLQAGQNVALVENHSPV